MSGISLSASTARALTIIRDTSFRSPKEFAKRMWPDSPAWAHHSKCGRGSHRGGGMYLAAGGYLGKLVRRELVCVSKDQWGHRQYQLSRAGNAALTAWEQTRDRRNV